jgi:hypothetical protein
MLDDIPTSLDFTEDEWSRLNDEHDRDDIIKWMLKIIRKNDIPFPQTEYTEDEIRDSFKKLQDYDMNKLMKKDEYSFKFDIDKKWDKSMGVLWGASNVGNVSSNYFHEKVRFNVNRLGRLRPNYVWSKDDQLFGTMKSLWSFKFKSIGIKEMKSMFRLGMYQAGQFKVVTAKAIYDYFQAENIADMSMGWGDRLAGFNASKYGKYYYGTDPNTLNYNNYHTQHDFYNTGKEIDIHCEPSEDLTKPPKHEIDLSFTSPPYFNREQYVDEDTQSFARYRTIESWLNDYMFKTIKQQWKYIKSGGIFAINIADILNNGKWVNICDPINEFINTIDGSKYLGHMGMKISKRPTARLRKEISGSLAEPIFVWQKA